MHKYYVHSKYFYSEWAAWPIFIIGLYRTHNKVRVLRANNRSKVSYLSRLLQVIKYLQIESLNELKKCVKQIMLPNVACKLQARTSYLNRFYQVIK